MKKINWLGHKWYLVGASTLGPDYVQLRRVSFLSDLQRRGSVATVIDASKADLIKNNINFI